MNTLNLCMKYKLRDCNSCVLNAINNYKYYLSIINHKYVKRLISKLLKMKKFIFKYLIIFIKNIFK